MNYIFSVQFLLFFLTNAIFLKAAAAILLYQIVPVDIMPVSLLGSAGYIDNTIVIFVGLAFAVGKVGLEFYRANQ